jgi:uncharacterized protein
MSNKLERRMYAAEFRTATEEGQPTKLVGYCAVFNQPTDLGYFTEVVKPGAFTRTLKDGADVRALFNHDPNLVLGRTKDGGKSGTLTLEEDDKGLRFEVVMPDTQVARDLMTLVQRGDVDQCSFGFYIREQNWLSSTDAEGKTTEVREILDVDLIDASAVTYPAYPTTSVEARAKFLFPEGKPEIPEHRYEQRAAESQNNESEVMQMRIRLALA